jgi:molybdate transport system substrate-binding protein
MKMMRIAIVALFAGVYAVPAMAAEIRVLCAGAARSSVVPLVDSFARESGHEVKLEFGTAGQIQAKLKEGARPDVLIVTSTVIAELEKAGTVAAGSAANLGRTGVGVAVREGAPLPDISSVDAFRRALLAAKAVAYIDPAAGGTSGKHFAAVLARLGIENEIKAKAVLVPGGYAAERVAKGEADIVIHQISEILPVKGVKLVGPLPPELQLYTTYTAALVAGTPNAEAARAWIQYLSGPVGRRSFTDRGLEAPR